MMKIPYLPAKTLLAHSLLAVGLMCAGQNSYAADYYIAPNGLDSNNGTSAATALQTWSKAFETMDNGDNLTVLPGVWSEVSNYCSTSGITPCYDGAGATMELDCADPLYDDLSNINITALNERQSFIQSDGFAAIRLLNCVNWTIEGIRAASLDNSDTGPTPMSVVQLNHSEHIDFKKMLVTHNNRHFNTHLLAIIDSNNVLVEGSEFYYFHRHGISVTSNSHHVTTRGNFLDSRMYADLPPPAKQSHENAQDMGDECITFYWTNDNLSENDIGVSCEGIQATGSRNRIFGDIVLDSDFGFRSAANCINNGPGCDINVNYPTDNEFKDVLSIRNEIVGIDCDSSVCEINNATVVDSGIFNVAIRDRLDFPGYDTFAEVNNSIAVTTRPLKRNDNPGFLVDSAQSLVASNLFANFNNQSRDYLQGQSNYSGFNDPGVSGTWYEIDPKLTCLLDLDETNSPVSTKTSEQVGADLRHKYIDGIKTTDNLFTASGNFSYCGAVIDGVNSGDRATYLHSCMGIKEQLGLGTNGACKAQGL